MGSENVERKLGFDSFVCIFGEFSVIFMGIVSVSFFDVSLVFELINKEVVL